MVEPKTKISSSWKLHIQLGLSILSLQNRLTILTVHPEYKTLFSQWMGHSHCPRVLMTIRRALNENNRTRLYSIFVILANVQADALSLVLWRGFNPIILTKCTITHMTNSTVAKGHGMMASTYLYVILGVSIVKVTFSQMIVVWQTDQRP